MGAENWAFNLVGWVAVFGVALAGLLLLVMLVLFFARPDPNA